MERNLNSFDSAKCPKFNPNDKFTACQYYDPASTVSECGFCKLPEHYRCIADETGCVPLSHSSVQDFLSCHRLYYLRAIRGVQVKDASKSTPLKLGSLWDKVIQKYLGADSDIPALIDKYEIPSRNVAVIRALYRAYKMLEIKTESGYELQSKIDLTLPLNMTWPDGSPVELLITGYYDRKYPAYFVENKLSSRPLNYLDVYFIQSQVGTYFLADPSLDFCIMEVVRIPDLKANKNNEEDDETYGERVYQDIISRPSHYFLGYDNKTHTYGKKYYRKEFDLSDIESRFVHIYREIFNARLYDGWYRDDKACTNILPGISCDYLPICRHGCMNENNFEIRKRVITF